MGGQRSVGESGRHVQPGLAVGLHDERVRTGQGLRPARVLGRLVVRRLVLLEVGDVVPGPLAPLRVPPHQRLPLAPRPALGVGGGAVVQDPPVGRPGPRPLGRHPVLLPARLAAGGLVDAVGVHPAVDPAAAGRGAVGLELLVGGERIPLGVPAVDLGEDGFRVRFGLPALRRVLPGQVEHRPVHLVGGPGELPPDDPPQVVGEPQVAARVAGRFDRLVVPLEQPLGVGEAAVLLGVRGGRQEEHLGADVLRAQLPGLDLGAVLPPGRRLDQGEVADDQPVQVGHAEPHQLGVGVAHGGVLAEQEVALADAVQLGHRRLVRRVRARQPGQVVEAEVVVGPRRVTPVRLEQAHHVRPHVAPVALVRGLGLDEGVQVLVLVGVRHRDVAGEQVEQGRDVRGPLDGGVPAQGQDASAGPADVAEQGLQDGGRPDVLDPDRVLRPADRVGEGRRPVASGVVRDQLADLTEEVLRHPADLLDQLGRVAGVVPLEHLEHTARVGQRLVPFRFPLADRRAAGAVGLAARRLGHRAAAAGALLVLLVALAGGRLHLGALVLPARVVVAAVVGVQAGEDAGQVLGVPEVLPQDHRRVAVRHDVLAEVLLVLEHVVDDPAEEGDVRARAQRHVQVGERAGAGEPGVDMDHLRAAGLGLHHPLEPDRMALGHVRALDDDAVRVLQVLLEGGRAAAAERGSQTGNGGGVSNTRLVLDLDRSQRGEQLLEQVVLFVVERGPAEAGDAQGAPGAGLVDLPLPAGPPGLDHPVGDYVHGRVQVQPLPLGAVRAPVEDLVLAGVPGGQLEARRPLGAQPSA